ncbi:hypothetical protein JCM8547_007293 [Rhodosporidiobolus lusitaniae]
MDLQALRAKALQTKNRKRALAALRKPLDDDEREEGELEDDPSPPAPSSLVHPAGAPVQGAGADAAYGAPPLAVPPVPYLSPQALHAIKEESKAIIAELLTYGVPPDYLLSIGVSRDILEISIHELNLDLSFPLPPAPFPPALVSTNATPFIDSSIASPAISPVQSTAVLPAPAPSADLPSLEARKRAELLARKAALSARNQKRAQSLESELENLFSSAAPVAASSVSPGPPDGEPDRKRPKLRSSASAISSLREAVEHTEEVVDVPEDGPFASQSASGATSVAVSSARANGAALPPGRRPVATDFEADATIKMSAQALAAQRVAAYLPRESTSMIIELSDDEDSVAGDGDVEMEDGAGAHAAKPSRVGSTTSPSPVDASASSLSSASEDQRKHDLEEKNRELQRLKDRIAALERKKIRKSSVEPGSTGEGAAALSEQQGARGQEAAQDGNKVLPLNVVARIMYMVEEKEESSAGEPAERGSFSTYPHGFEPHPAAFQPPVLLIDLFSALPSVAPFSLVSITLLSTCTFSRSIVVPANALQVFRPYQSSLSRFPLCRASALPTTAIPETASTTATSAAALDSPEFDTNSLGSAGVASWTARKHGVDTSKRLCKAEANGGKCLDRSCKSVHIAQFVPTDAELAEYESLRPPTRVEQSRSSST